MQPAHQPALQHLAQLQQEDSVPQARVLAQPQQAASVALAEAALEAHLRRASVEVQILEGQRLRPDLPLS